MLQWYVLFTKPRAEFRAATALRTRGVEPFLPTVPGRTRRQPLFPRYLFCQVDLTETLSDVLHWTPGLVRPLRNGTEYITISQEAIDLIRRRVGEIEHEGGLPAHDFKPGDPVRITSGPMQGLYGVFERSRSASERVNILIDFLNQTNRVEIDVEQLEPAPSAPDSRPPRRTRGRGRRIRRSGDED